MAKWCEICEVGMAAHKCFCGDCEKIHFICEECYAEGKRTKNIYDKKYKQSELNKDLKKKLK
jgi:NifB/MoaA-like Fe-S oxidoreductase